MFFNQVENFAQTSRTGSKKCCITPIPLLSIPDENKDKPKVKRNRTIFTKQQVDILEEAFQISHNLNQARCERLMELTGIERKMPIVVSHQQTLTFKYQLSAHFKVDDTSRRVGGKNDHVYYASNNRMYRI